MEEKNTQVIWPKRAGVFGYLPCGSKNNKAINKQHRFYSDCVQDLSKVYRSDDDTGKTKREKPTPDPATIIRNLDRFAEKWQHISDTQLTDDPLLRESFQEQVQNLRQHINEGCLLGIPPGYSTSINEYLHE